MPWSFGPGRAVRVVAGLFFVLGAATLLSACEPTPSCTATWVGPAGGDFATPANWDGGAVPGGASRACAPVGSSIVVHTTASVGSMDLAGTIDVVAGGVLTIDGPRFSKVSRLAVSGGSLTGNGRLDIVDDLTWTSGTMSGAGATSVVATGTTAMTGAVTMSGGRILVVNGDVTFPGTALSLCDDALFAVRGTLGITAPSTVATAGCGTVGKAALVVPGTLLADADLAASVPTVNWGTVHLRNGATFDAATYVQDFRPTATTDLDAGTTLRVGDGVGVATFGQGTLRGNGLIRGGLTGAPVIEPGDPSVPGSIGTLYVSTSYTPAPAASLVIDIDGPTPGTEHDQLSVGQTATVDGTLTATLGAGYTPAAGTTIEAVQTFQRTGSFASATLPGGTGLSWGVAYSNRSAGLSAQSATVASNISPVPAGQAVTFDAAVASPIAIPTGTVTFLDGATVLGTAPVDATGHAAFAALALGAGTHQITATYPGDGLHGVTVTGALAQSVVTPSGATPVITWAAPSAITYGTALGAEQLSASTPVLGTLTYSPSAGAVLAGGPRLLSVVFTPADPAAYDIATKTVPLTVDAAATSTTLLVGPNPVDVSNPLYLAATVTAPGTSAPPAGRVEFRDGVTLVGHAEVDAFGQAMITTHLSVGTHPITATFVATPNFGGSTSISIDAVVNDLCSQAAGPGVDWSSCDKHGLDLHGADLTGAVLVGTDLSGANLSGAHLAGAELSGADLTGATLSGTDLTGAGLTGVSASDADASGADLTGADLRFASFDQANLTGAKLGSARIDDTNLFAANLKNVTSGLLTGTPVALPTSTRAIGGYLVGPGVDLTGADLSGRDLLDVSLSRVKLTNAGIGGATLGAVTSMSGLTSAGLVGTPTSLPAGYVLRNGFIVGDAVNLTGADLRSTDLHGLFIGFARLDGADLSGADLTGTDLQFASMVGADFSTATLVDADLHNGDLTSATFTGADLTRTVLKSQSVAGATFTSATLTGIRSSQLSGVPAALPVPWKLLGGSLIGPGADLHGANLDDLDLTGADLTGANLTAADMRRATIGGVPFAGATLTNLNSGELVGAPASLPAGWQLLVGPSGGILIGPEASFLGQNLDGFDFSGLDLTGVGFGFTSLNGANFTGANLTRASFWHATIGGANFTGVTFTEVSSGSLSGTPATLPANWSIGGGYLIGPAADLTDADLSLLDLSGAHLAGATMKNANLNGANLSGADLTGATLTGATLTGATLTGTSLSGATLTGVVSGAITGAPASLPTGWLLYSGMLFVPGPGSDLHGLDLTGIDLTGIDLTGANLAGATLTNATLTNATLTGASLAGAMSGGVTGAPAALPAGWSIRNGYLVGPGANLTGASLAALDLTNADLSGTNLTNADLGGADLTGAKLTNATVAGTMFTGATLLHVSSGGLTGTPASLPSPWQDLGGYLVGPGADLANADLSTADFGVVDLHGATLAGANLLGARTGFGSTLAGVDFTGANLQGFDVRGTNLTNATLVNVNVQWAIIVQSPLTGVRSGGVTGTPTSLENATLVGGYLVGPGVNLNAEDLSGLDFTGLDLRGANLGNAKMATTTLTNVRSGLILGAPLTLPTNWIVRSGYLLGPAANVSGEDLTGIFLTNTDLTGADLSGSILTSTDVDAANLTGANLTGVRSGNVTGVAAALPTGWSQVGLYLVGPGADLSSEDLSGLDFTNANLTNANLTSANLQGVQLGGATLSGATLSNLRSGSITGAPLSLPTSWVIAGARLFGPSVNASALDLTGIDLGGVALNGANFATTNLTNAKLDAADLTSATLTDVTFTGATFGTPGVAATYVNLSHANLNRAIGPGGSTASYATYAFDTVCSSGAWAINYSFACRFVGAGW